MDDPNIEFKADGPNKKGKYTGYVSIDGRPSLYTVQTYSTPEEAISEARKLLDNWPLTSDF